MHTTLKVKGETFYLVPEADYQAFTGTKGLPPFPPADVNGDVPAIAYARASIARSIIKDRQAIGWSQAELARRAGVRVETLNRIERAKVSADESTVRKLTKAMKSTKGNARTALAV